MIFETKIYVYFYRLLKSLKRPIKRVQLWKLWHWSLAT